MGSVLVSMVTIRPNRPTSAALALAVLLGVVTLGAAMGLTSAGAATGESRLTTRSWTVEQMVREAKARIEELSVEQLQAEIEAGDVTLIDIRDATAERLKLLELYGARLVPARDFFKGIMTTALREDELLTEVRLPATPPSA